jgi:non-specific serine/threonine protein kinase
VYVLHALFTEAGSWELWAEDSGRPLTDGWAEQGGAAEQIAAENGGSGRPELPGRLARHPFAAEPAVVAALLAAAGGDVAAATSGADLRGSVPLALPSHPRGPAPSLSFARFLADGLEAEADALRAWIVPTVALGPRDGAALLAALEGDRLATFDASGAETDIPLADTVRYAAAVAQFADALVRRGEVLPEVEHDEDTGAYRASWRPAYSLETAAHRKALIDAMPPVFRAQQLGAEPVGRVAADVLDGAVGALVDAYAAAALTGPHGLHGEPLTPVRSLRSRMKPSAAALWLDALAAASGGRLDLDELDERAAARFAQDLADWREHYRTVTGPVRTCFRLVAPDEPAGLEYPIASGAEIEDADEASDPASRRPGIAGIGSRWVVELLLQSTEDPSLLASADEVWRRKGAARLLRAAGAQPRQDLLAGLGRASRVFPALGLALRQPAPTEVVLDDDGAYDFLTRIAPALAGNGFGVLLPSWWSAGRAELALTLTGAPAREQEKAEQPGMVRKQSGFGLDDLVDYRWEVSLGGQKLTDDEFRALADAKSGLVQLRGKWVEVDRDKLSAGLKALGDRRGGTLRAGEFLRAAMFGPAALDAGSAAPGPLLDDDAIDALPLERVEAGGWLGDLLSDAPDLRCAPMPAPPGMHAVLRPYQERGVGWLSFMEKIGLGAVLADSMGLGKTVQILALLEAERADEAAAAAPTLLICPMSLVANWQREAGRFTPELSVHVHHGAERLSGAEFRDAVEGAQLVITTYGLALRDREQLAAAPWHRVVVDEAQAIKNAATKQARAVRSLPAPHRVALTGTPVENRLADLWAIMEFANPGLLGTAESFRERFARPIERDGDERAAARLRRTTGAFVLRREKTDPAIIDDLPAKVEMKVLCNLTKEQASLYQATVDELLREIAEAEGIARRGLVLAMLTRLKQICNHPAHFLKDGSRLPGRSGKLARVEELCDEVLAAGERALLFTQYAEFGTMLRGHLAERFGREVAFLHGGVPKRSRDAMVRRFEEPDGPPLFVLSLKAGGVGLNLTAANHVVHVDRWWNPAVEDQATDRAFRIGQRRDVQVRKLMCAGTLEERIDQVIEDKRDLAERIVGSGEGWMTELSVAQLRDVVRLADDAVVE